MRLNKIDDPRSPLDKLTRKELEYLARKERRDEIEPGMPADLMREIFKNNPPAQWPRPMNGSLGSMRALRIPPYDEWVRVAFQPVQGVQQQEVAEVNAVADLKRQWEAQKKAPPEPEKQPNTMAALRTECKRRGIKMARTDNMATLRAKLDGENPSQLH